MIVWECERKPPDRLRDRLYVVLGAPGAGVAGGRALRKGSVEEANR